MVFGLSKVYDLGFRESCIYRTQSKHLFLIGKAWRASKCLELIHTDLCGAMNTKSVGGSRYFLFITNDNSHMSWVCLLENKLEAFGRFKKLKTCAERQNGVLIKTLWIDRGEEFITADFTNFYEENGICRELTTSYTPEKNNIVERKNWIVVEMARSMMQAKGLSTNFWAEAVAAAAVYILNLSPTRVVRNRTPFEAWTAGRPMISHLKVFGCIADLCS